jgi:hypothetical protein
MIGCSRVTAQSCSAATSASFGHRAVRGRWADAEPSMVTQRRIPLRGRHGARLVPRRDRARVVPVPALHRRPARRPRRRFPDSRTRSCCPASGQGVGSQPFPRPRLVARQRWFSCDHPPIREMRDGSAKRARRPQPPIRQPGSSRTARCADPQLPSSTRDRRTVEAKVCQHLGRLPSVRTRAPRLTLRITPAESGTPRGQVSAPGSVRTGWVVSLGRGLGSESPHRRKQRPAGQLQRRRRCRRHRPPTLGDTVEGHCAHAPRRLFPNPHPPPRRHLLPGRRHRVPRGVRPTLRVGAPNRRLIAVGC